MRIDEALGEIKPLEVKIGRGVLNVEYRPPAHTIAQMMEAQANKDDPERAITMIQELIHAWDLTRIEKVVVEPNGDPVEREVPVDPSNRDDIKYFVPDVIITAIVKAIRADNDVSGE